jgi:hypothetical protein
MSDPEVDAVDALLQTAARAFNKAIRIAAEQDLDVVLTTYRRGGDDDRLRGAPVIRVRIRQRHLMGSAD